MDKNILITGGAGFIGSHLVLRLVSLGYNVTVLDCLSPQVHGNCPEQESPLYQSIAGKIRFVKGDVSCKADWLDVLKNQNVVIHLAAETGTGQSMYHISNYTQVNVGGTAHLLDYLVNTPNTVKKVIIASSRAVYGEGKYAHPDYGVVYPKQRTIEAMCAGNFEVTDDHGQILSPLPTDEDAPVHPTSIYGITKLTQEQMVHRVCGALGICSVAFRFQNVYGEGQSLCNPYTGILSVFSNQILSGKSVNIFEDGLESRDFIHVEDVVDAIVLSIQHSSIGNRILNIGTSVPTTVLRVAELLLQNYGKDVPLRISGRFRVGDIRHNFADLRQAKMVLGFEPKISFEEGIARFTRWVLQQSIKENRLEESYQEMAERKLFF